MTALSPVENCLCGEIYYIYEVLINLLVLEFQFHPLIRSRNGELFLWWSILLLLDGTKLVSAWSLNYFYRLKIMIIVSNLLFVPIRLWSNLILCIFGPLNNKCTDKNLNIWTLKPTALKPISLFWYDFIKLNKLTFIKLRKIMLLFSNLNRPTIKFSDVNQWLFSFLDYGIAFK